MIPRPRPDVRVRRYRGVLLLARAEDTLELSDVAAFVWRNLDGQTSLADLAHAVATEYSIDHDTAYADCAQLIRSLTAAGMVDLATE
jgi:hypothetical protein